MAADALTGGVVKLSVDVLKNFANQNLESFIEEYQAETALQDLRLFADSQTGGGSPGVSPSGAYYQLLPGVTQTTSTNPNNPTQ